MGLDFPSMTPPLRFFMLKVVFDALEGAGSPFFSFGTYEPEVKFCSVRALLTGETSARTHQAESEWVGGAARLPVEKGQIKSAGQVAVGQQFQHRREEHPSLPSISVPGASPGSPPII